MKVLRLFVSLSQNSKGPSHKTTFCSLRFIFFTDRGIPAHFLTHARILKTEYPSSSSSSSRAHSLRHIHHSLSLSHSQYLSFSLPIEREKEIKKEREIMDMIRAMAESDQRENRRGQSRANTEIFPAISYLTLLYRLFPLPFRFINSL